MGNTDGYTKTEVFKVMQQKQSKCTFIFNFTAKTSSYTSEKFWLITNKCNPCNPSNIHKKNDLLDEKESGKKQRSVSWN